MENTTYRNEQKINFVQVSNNMLRDKNLSLRAKGLLSLLLSHSDEWHINHKSEIKNHIQESKDTYYKTLNELKEAGYVVYEVQRDGSGRIIGHLYRYSDTKIGQPYTEIPELAEADIKNTNLKNTKPMVLYSEEVKNGERSEPFSFTISKYLNSQEDIELETSSIEKALEVAKELPAKDPDKSKNARALQVRAIQNLNTKPSYELHDKPKRLFCKGYSLQFLETNVRDTLLKGHIKLDLVSAQFTILAKVWNCPELLVDNLWQTLMEQTGIQDKPILKKLVYASCFGSTFTSQMKVLASSQGITESQAKKLLRTPVLKRLFNARDKAFAEAREQGYLVNAWGDRLDFRGEKELRSAMASMAQSYEMKLLEPALRHLMDNNVFITVYLHDGFYIPAKFEAYVDEAVRLTGERAEELGIKTRLEVTV